MSDPHWPASGLDDDRDALPEIGRRLASPRDRIAATIIDWIIVSAPIAVAALIIGLDDAAENAPLLIGSSVWAALYDIVQIGRWGATIGKRVLGIRVVRQIDGVTPPGIEVAIKRWLVNLVGLVPWLFMVGVGLIAASTVLLFVDLRRRALHDHVAGTYVVMA